MSDRLLEYPTEAPSQHKVATGQGGIVLPFLVPWGCHQKVILFAGGPMAGVIDGLPHDDKSEMSLIGAILIGGNEFLADAAGLRPDSFYQEIHRWIWQAILALNQAGMGVDPITVEYEMERAGRGRPAKHLAECVYRCPTPFHTAHYARIVRDLAERRRVIAESGQRAGDAWEGKRKPDSSAFEL